MRVLWVGTKAPWPPRDGGRLVAWLTLRALEDAGHVVTLVTPAEDERPRGLLSAGLRAVASGLPVTAVRHAAPAVAARVERLVAGERFDVVHAEQPHALAACAPAFARGLPVVLRAHNVEADLWRAAGEGPGLRALLARREAPRVLRWERDAVRRCARTVALSEEDAARLRTLAGADGRVVVVPPAFPPALDPGPRVLPGRPAVVVAGSAGWLPNQRGAAWFAGAVWPAVRDELPEAHAHVFGGAPVSLERATWHAPPDDAADAFAAGSVQVIPLPFASGVRMRILEAWARGLPVVATTAAASGLAARDGRELLLADTPAAFAGAVARLHREPALGEALVARGRARLQERHDPAAVAAALARVYEEATASSADAV
ncbi:MAG: glycosyltransferase family 4 protein [Vicinamibacteria bacterium]